MENTLNEPALKYGISPEQYLQEENELLEKHEYYQGEVFAMCGASFNHNAISVELIYQLKSKLKGNKCRPFGSDMRLHIPENTLYTYPDISVYCGDVELTGQPFDTAMNPVMIIEILSKSTENYDRGKKFVLYRQINTLTEYILVDSQSIHVEHHSKKGDGFWEFREYKNPEGIIEISSLNIKLKVSEIYSGLIFL